MYSLKENLCSIGNLAAKDNEIFESFTSEMAHLISSLITDKKNDELSTFHYYFFDDCKVNQYQQSIISSISLHMALVLFLLTEETHKTFVHMQS